MTLRRPFQIVLVSLVLASCGGGGGSNDSNDPSGLRTSSHGWRNVKMGGGGYVPGVVYHPTVRNLRYARTDMAGVYRWDQARSSWIPLTDGFGRPDGNHQGAESMAVDPTDANKVYMTTSQYVSNPNGRFYYSSNQGRTWNHVELPFPVGSNNQGRAIGERLVVDPNLPSTLYYASRTAGLWTSTDSGLNWSQTLLSSKVLSEAETKAANGGSPIGVEFVVLDATIPTSGFTPTGSATQTLYAGIAPDYKGLAGLSHYLYKSTNGGATWTGVALPDYVTTTLTSAIYIPHMARAADGKLYVPFTSSSGPGSGGPSALYKFDGNAAWTQLRTNASAGMGGVAVYGTGSATKIALGISGVWGNYNDLVLRSEDDGQTWTEIGWAGSHVATGTTAENNPGYSGWVDDLDIDPFNPNHISYVTGGGIWSTRDAFSTTTPRWSFDVTGVEEMVNLGMAVPPPEAPYLLASAHGDTGLYIHTSLNNAPSRSPNLGSSPPLNGFGNGTGIDMAWSNPAYIAAVGSFEGTSDGAWSTDSGVTWTKFPTLPASATATGDGSGVAVTADGATMIWAISGQVPSYTTDNGTTWHDTNLPAPKGAYRIAADRKNALKVYAYDNGNNWWYRWDDPPTFGRFYYSTDGGHTFTAIAQTWAPNGFNVTDLAANPFLEGDLWLADADSLWHSTDSGLTWTKLTAMMTVGAEPTNFHGAIKVALGVPATGSTYSAAVYLVGTINGKDGVYRSDDEGITWTRIDDDAHRYGGVSRIAADTRVYGRVFLAGRGMVYNY